MIKKVLYLYILLHVGFCFSQTVFLTEAKNIGENKDKFLYAFYKKPDSTIAKYLGKIEVSGFSNDDVAIFNEIYKKAKTISANYFYINTPENIAGQNKFNPNYYTIYIYDVESSKIKKEENQIYLINPEKETEIRINNKKIKLPARSYIKYDLSRDNITDISVGKFLGSRIKLQSKDGQAEQYFQISGKKISASSPSNPGINFKTGDVIRLEKSYAQFLISIYQPIIIN